TDRKGVRIRCTAFRESRSCANSRRYYLKDIESVVINGIREELRDRRLIEHYVQTYNKERLRLVTDSASWKPRLAKRLAANESERQRIVERVGTGVIEDEDAKARLTALRAERQDLQAKLVQADAPVSAIALHPALIDKYLGTVGRLAEFLRE